MPQMAPMWWTTLFMFFIMSFMFMFNKSYFMTSYKLMNKTKKDVKTIKINWKW